MIRLIAVALVAVGAASAGAATPPLTQLPGAAGCVAPRTAGCTAGGIGAPAAAAVSPNGRTVYAAGGIGSNGAMAILRRDRRTGRLSTLPGKRGCVHVYRGSRRCEGVRALETPSAIAIPADEGHVYVAAASNRAVSTFVSRPDGSLVQPAGPLACVATNVARCLPVRGLAGPASLAVSPDGRSLYAVGNSAIVVLRRFPGAGILTQPDGEAGCVTVRGAFGCARLDTGARIFRGTVAVSPDGTSVYAATGGSLYVFARDEATGGISERACFDAAAAAGCARVEGLGRPEAVAVSADGTLVYTTGGGRSVLVFRRDPSGALVRLGAVRLPFRAVSLAPAGRRMVVGGDRGVAIVDGTTVRGAVTRIRGPRGPYGVAASPDGRSVYAAGRGGVAVLAAR